MMVSYLKKLGQRGLKINDGLLLLGVSVALFALLNIMQFDLLNILETIIISIFK